MTNPVKNDIALGGGIEYSLNSKKEGAEKPNREIRGLEHCRGGVESVLE